jgi:nitrogen fixation NifU-like protein
MSELRELYQEVILDHYKRPRNQGRPDGANRSARGANPLCGDKLTLYLRVIDDRIESVGFEGQGCAISTASASLLSESIKGKTLKEFEDLYRRFHDLVTGDPEALPDTDNLGKLAVLAGVREFPVRVKCATLAWHTASAALDASADDTVSTE